MKEILFEAGLYLFAGIGVLVVAAGGAASRFPPESAIGAWLAWFGAMPVGHLPQIQKTEKKEPQ